MNTKFLMAGMLLAVMILTTTGAALAPFDTAFSAVYGRVTDGGAGVNGAYVSLTANGVTLTTVTVPNNRGEPGFYMLNIPLVITPLTLSVTTANRSATTTIITGGRVDLAVQTPVLPVLTAITVSPQTAKVVVGNTQTFSAAAFDQFAKSITATATWSSSDTAVGTIDSGTGVFTALTAGTTTITAKNGNIIGTATVTVLPATPVLTTISVTPGIALVSAGGTRNFTATTLDQFGNPIIATVTWSSSNTAVGTIDPNTGVFTALTNGNITITAASGTVIGSAAVTVATQTVIIPVVTTITVTPDIVSLGIGSIQTFTAATFDQIGNPMNATVTWNSSDQSVGIINPVTGVFTALASGSAFVDATNGNISGIAAVIVNVAPAPVLIANITSFNVGNGARAGAIRANVTVKNLDTLTHKFVTVVSGVNGRGYPLAGTGVVVDLNPGQSIRIPVQVTVPSSADVGSYSLLAGVFPFDNEILDPTKLIGNLAGPGIATVS